MAKYKNEAYKTTNEILLNVVLGEYEIVKLPWKPKYNDLYFYPSVAGKNVEEYCWEGDTTDLALQLLGMCYRTREEAEEHLAEDYKKLTGKEIKE